MNLKNILLIKIELPYDLMILLLGVYPKECKTGYSTNTCALMFTAALFTIAKLWKQPGALWLRNESRKCGRHNGVLLSHRE
jgi:hypothetical protein